MTENKDTDFPVAVSEQMIADLSLLKEAPFFSREDTKSAAMSVYKYSTQSVDKLSQHLVCRHYGKLTYELTHLYWAIINSASSEEALLQYFYIDENVSPQSFSLYFSRCLPCAVAASTIELKETDTAKVLTIAIREHEFSIFSSRANLLACFNEWLASLRPSIFDEAFSALYGKSHNAIQLFSSDLQKHIYTYLNKHLPPAKAQSKYHFMRQWLDEEALRNFSDESLLSFWRSAKNKEGMSRFTTVVRDVFQFEEAVFKAQSMSDLQYAGDIDEHIANEQCFESLTHIIDTKISLDTLTQSPKLLSKQQRDNLQLLADYQYQCCRFPLSWLRYHEFGQYQAKCIQAQRNKSVSEQTFALANANPYAQWLQNFHAQLTLNTQSCLAIIHIFVEEKNDALFDVLGMNLRLLASYIPDMQKGLRALTNANEDITLELAEMPTYLEGQPEVLAELIQAAKLAFSKNKRQGFTPDTILTDKTGYIESAEQLSLISNALQSCLEKNRKLFDDLLQSDEKYRADGSIFQTELRQRIRS